jgi:hypothetical protein
MKAVVEGYSYRSVDGPAVRPSRWSVRCICHDHACDRNVGDAGSGRTMAVPKERNLYLGALPRHYYTLSKEHANIYAKRACKRARKQARKRKAFCVPGPVEDQHCVCGGAPQAGGVKGTPPPSPPLPPGYLLTSFHAILIGKFGGHLPTSPLVLTPLSPRPCGPQVCGRQHHEWGEVEWDESVCHGGAGISRAAPAHARCQAPWQVPGMLTQGVQGARLGPLGRTIAWDPHPLTIEFARDRMEVTYMWPPWLSGSHRPRQVLHRQSRQERRHDAKATVRRRPVLVHARVRHMDQPGERQAVGQGRHHAGHERRQGRLPGRALPRERCKPQPRKPQCVPLGTLPLTGLWPRGTLPV